MSCHRSTASTESAAICLRALGWPWVAACQAREVAAVALRSPFQPITRFWQFKGLSVKHGPSDRFAPIDVGHLDIGRVRHPRAAAEPGLAEQFRDRSVTPHRFPILPFGAWHTTAISRLNLKSQTRESPQCNSERRRLGVLRVQRKTAALKFNRKSSCQ